MVSPTGVAASRVPCVCCLCGLSFTSIDTDNVIVKSGRAMDQGVHTLCNTFRAQGRWRMRAVQEAGPSKMCSWRTRAGVREILEFSGACCMCLAGDIIMAWGQESDTTTYDSAASLSGIDSCRVSLVPSLSGVGLSI